MSKDKPFDEANYIVWVDYGSEGWCPMDTADTFDEAVKKWKTWMRTSNGGCIINKSVHLVITEVVAE